MNVAQTENSRFLIFACRRRQRITEKQKYINLVTGNACGDLILGAAYTADNLIYLKSRIGGDEISQCRGGPQVML